MKQNTLLFGKIKECFKLFQRLVSYKGIPAFLINIHFETTITKSLKVAFYCILMYIVFSCKLFSGIGEGAINNSTHDT